MASIQKSLAFAAARPARADAPYDNARTTVFTAKAYYSKPYCGSGHRRTPELTGARPRTGELEVGPQPRRLFDYSNALAQRRRKHAEPGDIRAVAGGSDQVIGLDGLSACWRHQAEDKSIAAPIDR